MRRKTPNWRSSKYQIFTYKGRSQRQKTRLEGRATSVTGPVWRNPKRQTSKRQRNPRSQPSNQKTNHRQSGRFVNRRTTTAPASRSLRSSCKPISASRATSVTGPVGRNPKRLNRSRQAGVISSTFAPGALASDVHHGSVACQVSVPNADECSLAVSSELFRPDAGQRPLAVPNPLTRFRNTAGDFFYDSGTHLRLRRTYPRH